MRIIILLAIFLTSCKNDQMKKPEPPLSVVPITTTSTLAREHFEEARFLVQNGLDSNPIEQYEKALALDSTFVRMYNFISTYSPDDSIKRINHNLAKKYRHLVSEEEQMLVDATEYRLNNPEDIYESKLFELADRCSSDKYLNHTICFLLFRKNPSLAIRAGLKSVQIDKTYASGYNILGYAYINNGQLDKAETAFDGYIMYAPQRGNPYDSKGDLMLQLERYEEALALKKKAYQLDSTFDWIPEELLEIKAKMSSLKPK